MTTRRLRPEGPPRGRIGRLGLFGSSAMSAFSVDASEIWIDFDGPPQHAVERPRRSSTLEAGETATRIDATSRDSASSDETAIGAAEAKELRLRRLPPAAGTCPFRKRPHAPADSPSPPSS